VDDGARCQIQASRGPGRFAESGCGEPAVALVEYGCLHEHIGRDEVCAGHRDVLLAGSAGCARCWEGPPVSRHEPHRCVLLARVVASQGG
jgi:hypothetical protein